MTKARDLSRAFFSRAQPRQIRAGVVNPEQNTSVLLAKEPPNYRFFFFAKIAFQLSL
jgi:hypothetical protein